MKGTVEDKSTINDGGGGGGCAVLTCTDCFKWIVFYIINRIITKNFC